MWFCLLHKVLSLHHRLVILVDESTLVYRYHSVWCAMYTNAIYYQKVGSEYYAPIFIYSMKCWNVGRCILFQPWKFKCHFFCFFGYREILRTKYLASYVSIILAIPPIQCSWFCDNANNVILHYRYDNTHCADAQLCILSIHLHTIRYQWQRKIIVSDYQTALKKWPPDYPILGRFYQIKILLQ